MSTLIHADTPVVFPAKCIRCMSEEHNIEKFTDTTSGGLASFTVTVEIPICKACKCAPKKWKVGFVIFLLIFFASGIPFAIAQDNQVTIPKFISVLMLMPMVGALLCAAISRIKAPVRLVANRTNSKGIRLKILNDKYAEEFLEKNKTNARIINPWKYE